MDNVTVYKAIGARSDLVETKEFKRPFRGAHVKFVRRDSNRRLHSIYACDNGDGWEQWGAKTELLSDNVPAVEAWYRRRKQ